MGLFNRHCDTRFKYSDPDHQSLSTEFASLRQLYLQHSFWRHNLYCPHYFNLSVLQKTFLDLRVVTTNYLAFSVFKALRAHLHLIKATQPSAAGHFFKYLNDLLRALSAP